VSSLTSAANRPKRVGRCMTSTSRDQRTSTDAPKGPVDAKCGNRRTVALSICSNDVRTGSNPDVPSQVTVKALGYFGQT
jgi:hypothetical protein